MIPAREFTDEELVAQCLAGNRNAFGQIVARYQNLICSLAYSATGSLSQSEDLSQEAFVTAWKQLPQLEQPGKLRSWLCGIVRNLSFRALRGRQREPVHGAEQLDSVHEVAALEAHPLAQTISREEEAILWRALERIPETYREPLVLFYREQQSIQHVAQVLELTEDAVRQRLSRGRKLLQDEIATFVEGALRQTAPRQAFSNAVLVALPAATTSVASAGLTAGAKGSVAAKSGFLAACTALLAPFLGILAGVGAQCLVICRTTADRKLRARMIARAVLFWVLVVGVAWGGETAFRSLSQHMQWSSQRLFATLAIFWWAYCCLLVASMNLMARSTPGFGVNYTSSETSSAAAPTMNSVTRALMVASIHFALFWAFIRLAWVQGDHGGVWIISAAAAVLTVAGYFRIRGRTGADIARAANRHIGVCCGVILIAINLRIDVWVANAYGVSVEEAHRLQPTWMIPVLSVAFVGWTAVVVKLARGKTLRR
jgi:RNA polymerase sigma factor (sigma-70 family)